MTRIVEHEHRHTINISPGTRLFLTELVRPVVRALHRLEHHMTTVDQNLDTITTKVDAVSGGVSDLATAFTDLAADVRAALAALPTDTSPEVQAKFDTLSATLDATSAAAAQALTDLSALDTEVGDADGSDVPAEPTA